MKMVYVRLLDEGTEVFRPTEANALEDGTFVLLPSPGYGAADEQWEFTPGSVVRVGNRLLGGEMVPVAECLAKDAPK
jgi:hypothetical protein